MRTRTSSRPGRKRGNVGRRESFSTAMLIRERRLKRTTQMMNRPDRVDHAFVDFRAIALKPAVSGSILTMPEAGLAMMVSDLSAFRLMGELCHDSVHGRVVEAIV